MMYYINDGRYGGLNFTNYDGEHPVGRPLMVAYLIILPKILQKANSEEVLSVIWGPTCSPLDLVEVILVNI